MAKTTYGLGDRVPSHFDPAIVAGSYIASLCGCILAVELLHRRATGFYNLRSWRDTLMCATALGLVGIWCMHFIGNRAIILGSGQSNIQLVYNSGFSTLSVFLPIIGLSIAFATAEYPFRSFTLRWIALVCTGIFAGLSIVGMHYMGNFGISNYELHYEPEYLAASIVIAIGDCLIVLVLFYTLRDKWISWWERRAVCAAFLAGGVSAMHFTASTKCIYVLHSYSGEAQRRSRNVQVIVAGVLCATAAAIVFGVLFFTRHRSRVLKRSSRKIMLACVVFDLDGRILVTTEGILPAREIIDKFDPRTLEDDFDEAHPVFQWMFRVSRNWPCVSELIPKMKDHIGTKSPSGDATPTALNSRIVYGDPSPGDYSINFRERFCIAAASLASTMHLPLEKIGVLYDNIVDTGTIEREGKDRKRSTLNIQPTPDVLESGCKVSDFGRGQLLFLTRRLTAGDAGKMLNAGFKFGSMQQVGHKIADTMQIPLATLETHMSGLKDYVDNLLMLQKPGTWLSCFAMIPKPNSKGFDVVVKKAAKDQLPDAQLSPSEPTAWQASFLERMDNKTMSNCVDFLDDSYGYDSVRTQQEGEFALVVSQAITALSGQFPSRWLQNARFYGKPVYAHYSQALRGKGRVTTMYSFVICPDLHVSIGSYSGITRIPLSLFSVRHQCYNSSPNHLALAREVHKEFGPLLAHKGSEEAPGMKKTSVNLSNAIPLKKNTPRSCRSSMAGLSIDDQSNVSSDSHELADTPNSFGNLTPTATTPTIERDDIWGGILVNSETVVRTDSRSDLRNGDDKIGLETVTRVAVGTSKPEETFVDELCTFARSIVSSKGVHW